MLSKKAKKWKRGISIDKKRLIIFLWMMFCVLFVGYLLFCNIRIFQKREDLSKNLAELDNNIESLTKDKETLSFDLGQTYSPEYIEKVAREDLGMQKSGEQVVVIKKNDSAADSQDNTGNDIWNDVVNWFNSVKNQFLPE